MENIHCIQMTSNQPVHAPTQFIPALQDQPSYLHDKYQRLHNKRSGVYVPPHRLAQMQALHPSESLEEIQRATWQNLKKSINGIINKLSVQNIQQITIELFNQNLYRGRGPFARSLIKAQMANPTQTHLYAALVAIINTKLPQVALLVIKRVMLQFQRSYTRNNKLVCIATMRMIAHLVNQLVLQQLVALQLLLILLERPTDDSVELACLLMTEVGQVLSELSQVGTNSIFQKFKRILHEGEISKFVQYSIQKLFAVRKTGFKDHPGVIQELDLVVEEDRTTHQISLTEPIDPQDHLNLFAFDPNYQQNQLKWDAKKNQILGQQMLQQLQLIEAPLQDLHSQPQERPVLDLSERELVDLRRTIYLTIQSTYDQEECCHKILRLNIGKGHEFQLAEMIIQCCMMERVYQRFYGLLAQRFCFISDLYKETYQRNFILKYQILHRQDTSKIRNLAKFFGQLFVSEAIDWSILESVSLTEQDTTPFSRIFLKIFFKQLAQLMGIGNLKSKLFSDNLLLPLANIFRRDSLPNIRFAINYFISIGLGPLTDELKLVFDQLQQAPKVEPLNEIMPAPSPIPDRQAELKEKRRKIRELQSRKQPIKDNKEDRSKDDKANRQGRDTKDNNQVDKENQREIRGIREKSNKKEKRGKNKKEISVQKKNREKAKRRYRSRSRSLSSSQKADDRQKAKNSIKEINQITKKIVGNKKKFKEDFSSLPKRSVRINKRASSSRSKSSSDRQPRLRRSKGSSPQKRDRQSVQSKRSRAIARAVRRQIDRLESRSNRSSSSSFSLSSSSVDNQSQE